MSKRTLRWSKQPVAGDYRAAQNYLCLIVAVPRAKRLVSRMRNAQPLQRAAKDLLRASNLPLLPPEDAAVASDMKKIQKGKTLSPVLLVRGDVYEDAALIVADGYHRICAAYHEDEDAEVACLIASR